MFELIDDISEVVYIADPETYELFYLNWPGRQLFDMEEARGQKCYKVLQGRNSPCEFCPNDRLCREYYYTWNHTNLVTGRHYLLKDRLVEWQGRTAKLEIAFDITDQIAEQHRLRHALDGEKMLMTCVRHLYQAENLGQGMEGLLAQLGEGLSAQRAYVFEIKDGAMSNTFEWCAPGVAPQRELLQGMDTLLLTRWKKNFGENHCVVIDDLEDIREISPQEYEILASQGIHTLVATPLNQDNQLVGFVGVDNPAVEKLRDGVPLLNTLSYFLLATLERLADKQKLSNLSLHDTLTGFYNRNRYMQDTEQLKAWPGPLGVVHMDINAFKEINNRQGHAKGDEALCQCATMAAEAFAGGEVYRVGGDEFVVLQTLVEKEKFYRQVAMLRQRLEKETPYRMAMGAQWEQSGAGIAQMLADAEREMYEDKRRYYRSQENAGWPGQIKEDENLSKDNPLLKEYNMLMSSMQVSVSKHLLQEDFRVIWANDFFYAMTGYSKAEYDGLFESSCSRYFEQAPLEFAKLQAVISEAFAAGKPSYEVVVRMPCKGGSNIWINVVGTFTDETIDGVPVVYSVFTNVNDLVQAQKEQTITNENLPGFVAKMQVTQQGIQLLYGNRQFNEFLGQDDREILESNWKLNMKRNQETLHRHYAQMRRGDPISFEVSLRNAEGDDAYFQVGGECIDWAQGDPVYLVLFIDITESTLQRAQLHRMAFIDSITEGRNRTSFELDAGGAIRTAPPATYVLVSLDIEKFKVVNDLFGIEAGDRTLHYVYTVLERQLQPGEFAARISADTFSLLLLNQGPEALVKRMEDLAQTINSFNQGKSHKYLLSIAAGFYPVEEPHLPMTQLQDRATLARKQIKGANMGNQLCLCRFYDHKDTLRLSREKDIENRMWDALQSGEFLVYLQPKQDLRSGKIGGAEALVRWQHPEKGLVPPGDFIPLFEKNGFIVEVDLYVFEQVCRLMVRWQEEGLPLTTVSVNMSRLHLANGSFLSRYEAIRQRYGIDPQLLEIEITETLIFQNPQMFVSVIDEIRRCGYRCSIDDFGSGYSSLNTLKDIHVDTLKLDRAFFASPDMSDPREGDIIGVVVELAQKLHMTTVAEGIETPEQAQFLKKIGCDYLQGYLFSRPVPVAEFEKMMFRQMGGL